MRGKSLSARVIFFCLIGLATAWASVTATITGTVKDSAGAVVAGATVTAINTDTAIRTDVTTNAQGVYSLLALPVGHYELEVKRAGFKDYRQRGITLEVNQVLQQDVTLQVGTIAQTVEVSGTAVQVETASTQMGDVIETSKLESTPLNGRSYVDLLGLQPGVVPISAGTIGGDRNVSGNLSAGNISVSGQREAANGFMVNGGSVEEGRNNGTAIIPNLDSIAEFRLLTNNFDAEYGHFSGGLVNAITKSGTNAFHGDAFEFFRNQHLDARNFFDPARGAFSRNQFGGTFGGPIVRDKVFFFVDYQGTRETQGVSTGLIAVPSTDMRSGSFGTGLADAINNFTCGLATDPKDGLPIVDANGKQLSSPCGVGGTNWATVLSSRLNSPVQNGEPYAYSVADTPTVVNGAHAGSYVACTSSAQCVFPNATIPQSAFDPAAVVMMKFIPQANTGAFFSTSAQNETVNDNKGGIRIDGNSRFGMLSAYYFIDNSSLLDPYPEGFAPEVPGFQATTPGRAQQLNLSDTKSFGATKVNELRFNFMRDANVFRKPQGGVGPTLSSLGFVEGANTLGMIPVVPQYEGVPLMATNNFSFGLPDGTTGQYNNVYQWLDNFSKVAGTHTIKFGGELHYTQINERNTYAENGVFAFSGGETGNDFADYLIGAPASFIQSSRQFLDSRTWYDGWYAQDSWRARPNLTLNYGLRWEVSTPYYDTQNKIETIVPGENSQVFPAPAGSGALCANRQVTPGCGSPTGWVFPGDPGIPKTLAPVRWNNFGPRVGFAYSPNAGGGLLGALFGSDGRSSIRGSFGMFYTAVEDYTLFIEVGDAPYGLFYVSPVPPMLDTPYVDRATGNSEGQRFPYPIPAPGSTNVNWAQLEPISSSPGIATTDRLPYAEHYELSFERQLGANTVADFSYVGTQGHRLIAELEANPGNPALCLSVSQQSQVASGSSTCGPFGENGMYTTASGQVINSTRSPLGPLFGSDAYLDTMANSHYNAFEASLRHNSTRSSFLAAYTYSKSMDNASGVGDWIDPLNFRVSKALSAFDLTHNFVVSYSFLLPFDKLAPSHQNLAGGWRLTGVTHLATGLPIQLGESDDHSLLGTSGVDVPNYNGQPLSFTNPRSGQPYFNINAFTPEPLGQLGNANRRFFHGPGLNNFDMAMLKDLKLTESKSIEMRAEFFNIFNHAQFTNPTGNVNSSNFGLVTAARAPRIGQLGVKFIF